MYTHTYIQTDRQTHIHPQHQHNLKENLDQKKKSLGRCCHLHHQPLSQIFLLDLSSCHSLELSNLTLSLLPLNKLLISSKINIRCNII